MLRARGQLCRRSATDMNESKPFECQRPLTIHPLILYGLPWLLVAPLYALAWSMVLLYSASQAVEVTLVWIILPIFTSWIYWQILTSQVRVALPAPQQDLRHMLIVARWLLVGWFLISCVEVILGRGFPLIWFIRHEHKSAQDFGISSVHGMVNSALLAAATLYAYAGLVLGRRSYFWIVVIALFWSIAVVSRQMLMILVVQSALLFLQHRKINMVKLFLLCLVLGLCVLLLFGAIGDFRTPGFVKNAAGITKAYPAWLPSGFIWVYMYVTTPLNNLIHTIQLSSPLYDWSFPNTLQELFPSVVRVILFPYLDKWSGAGGSLVSRAFNVSSAYIGPAQDFGLLGSFIFAWVTTGLLVYFWRRRDVMGSLGYAVAGQCAFFSIFYNHFFYLPVIFQLFWFVLATERRSKSVTTGVSQHARVQAL